MRANKKAFERKLSIFVSLTFNLMLESFLLKAYLLSHFNKIWNVENTQFLKLSIDSRDFSGILEKKNFFLKGLSCFNQIPSGPFLL